MVGEPTCRRFGVENLSSHPSESDEGLMTTALVEAEPGCVELDEGNETKGDGASCVSRVRESSDARAGVEE